MRVCTKLIKNTSLVICPYSILTLPEEDFAYRIVYQLLKHRNRKEGLLNASTLPSTQLLGLPLRELFFLCHHSQ